MLMKVALLLTCVFLLSACGGRAVDVIQKDKFTAMANRMPQELVVRNILDSDGDYLAVASLSFTTNYGKILYDNLSPAFLFEQMVKDKASSFAGTLKSNEKLEINANGFSILNKNANKYIRYGTKVRRIDVDMVAITDWEGDGESDWIVTCRLLEKVGTPPKVFYLAIPNSKVSNQTRFEAKVIAIYEDLGSTGRMYLRDSQNPTVQEKKVQHVLPGLKNVTEPPKAGDVNKKPEGTVQVKSL